MGIILLLALVAVTSATTCFVHIGTNDLYDVMKRTTVETQRGCEVLCLANDTCAGFSFKDTGLFSPCVLLEKGKVPDQQCTQRFYFYSKETYGCTARTNITEEFGTDPSIDEFAPAAIRNLTGTVACTDDQRLNKYIIRAVTSDGRRISLDNTLTTFIVKSGDMWQYRDEGVTPAVTEEVVASVCASAGAGKCECGNLWEIGNANAASAALCLTIAMVSSSPSHEYGLSASLLLLKSSFPIASPSPHATLFTRDCLLHGSFMNILPILLALVAVTSATTCFVHIGTNDAYEVLERATVETQRGCEVLCLANDTCAGFSFEDTGLSSPCVLLEKGKVPDQQCTKRFYFYSKETYGCTARTNITEEFGVDPCIDEFAPADIQNLTGTVACTDDQRLNKYIIRAVTSEGRRISLDNTLRTFIVQSGDMWQYRDEGETPAVTEQIVAAVCASAGASKCECGNGKLYEIGIASRTQQSYAALPNLINPCADANANLNFKSMHSKGPPMSVDKEDTAEALITCKAGKWFGCFVRTRAVIAIEGAGCLKY